MKQIPSQRRSNTLPNTKAIKIIVALVILGLVTGIMLSLLFITEANEKIDRINDSDKPFNPGKGFVKGHPLKVSDIIFPSIGVISVCISTYLLAGLLFVYIKIFLTTNSRYIVGLLFFLTPLFLKSLFSINTLRALFISPAISYGPIKDSIGFEFGGLGNIIVMLSFFEIIGLSILLYLSAE